MGRNLTDKQKKAMKEKIWKAIQEGTFAQQDFANRYGCCRNTIRRIIARDKKLEKAYKKFLEEKDKRNYKKSDDESPYTQRKVEHDVTEDNITITTRSLDIKTLEDALRISKVDMKVWEVDRHLINSWEVTISGIKTGTDKCETYTNYQVKVWLKRKSNAKIALEEIYDKIKEHSPIVPNIHLIKRVKDKKIQRELEISIMDLHLGLRCYKGASDSNYSPEFAGRIMMTILDELLVLAKVYGPYERIIFPMGNDFLHADNVYGTTTSHTPQPEAEAWQNTFLHGEQLGLAIIERIKKDAPVKVITVPGNHARHSEIALGRLLNAYYHNDKNVEVDATLSPYKFHNYGVNLIGFEHGHSIRQQLRLAALMANECRLNGVWEKARYCEWHLGDQHRKASGKPMHFEEQGVSVEFLPGLVAPNEWHRIHSFNWQQRAGMAFVWDKSAGPISRFQVNVDNYTGKIMK